MTVESTAEKVLAGGRLSGEEALDHQRVFRRQIIFLRGIGF